MLLKPQAPGPGAWDQGLGTRVLDQDPLMDQGLGTRVLDQDHLMDQGLGCLKSGIDFVALGTWTRALSLW